MIRSGLVLTTAAATVLAGLSSRTLSPDGADTYVATQPTKTSVTVSAPVTNAGGNLRRVYWPAGQAARADGRVCETIAARSAETVQEGTVHNLTSTRAVTVTKNIWASAYWVWNAHYWDGPSFVQFAQFDMVSVMFLPGGGYRPLPWRICTRTVRSTLTFKIWFPPEPEPSWADPARARSATVPAGWTVPGQVGLYVGHLQPGQSLTYTGVAVA
jgi:hypothetical protein